MPKAVKKTDTSLDDLYLEMDDDNLDSLTRAAESAQKASNEQGPEDQPAQVDLTS